MKKSGNFGKLVGILNKVDFDFFGLPNPKNKSP